MNLKQLESFILVADLRSFTLAAQKLFMSQPAVSFQIKSLEEGLNATLFQREEKKVVLTEAGKLLYPEAKQMLKSYQNIKTGLDNLRGLKSGALKLGAGTIPGEYMVPWFMGQFLLKYPAVKIYLKVSGSGTVTKWLKEGDIDLAITGAFVHDDAVDSKPWLGDELILIVAPRHRWWDRGEVELSRLLEEPFIQREAGSGSRRAFEQIIIESGQNPGKIKSVMELGSTRAVTTAVMSGSGVSVVSRWAVREYLKFGMLKEIKVKNISFKRNIYVSLLKRGLGNYAAQEFDRFIFDEDNLKRFYVPST